MQLHTIVIRPGGPPPDDIIWPYISHVEVHGRLDDNGRKIVYEALTNSMHKVEVHAMDDEARTSLDPPHE